MRTRTRLSAPVLIGLLLVLPMFAMPAVRLRPAVIGNALAPAPSAPVTADAAAGSDAGTEWTLAGQLGGNVTDVAWFGRYALLGVGTRVAVIDVMAPDSPRWVASGPQLPDLVMGIAVSGDRVYVAAGESGLFVLNGSDPLNLQVAGALDVLAAAHDVQVSGEFAYLAADDGLHVVDVRDPMRPAEVGALVGARIPMAVRRLAVGDGMVVMTQWGSPTGNRSIIIDVRDPRQPLRVDEWEDEATDVVLAGDRAIVAFRDGLLVIDLANPAQEFWIDVGSAETRLRSVAVDGTIAYVGDERGTVHMIDIADPGQPRALGKVGEYDADQPVAVAALAARSGVVLAPSIHERFSWPFREGWYAGALRIFDATRPAEARMTAMLRLPSSLVREIKITADGRLAWVIDASGEVDGPGPINDTPDFARNTALLIDTTDPTRPRARASLPLPGGAEAVALAVHGSTVYVLGVSPSDSLAVHVFDGSDPDAPEFVRAVNLEGGSGRKPDDYMRVDMPVVGERLIVHLSHRVHMLNLSDPATPRIVEPPEWWEPTLAPSPHAGWVDADPFAYVLTMEGKAGIMDLRDPAMPRLAAILPIDELLVDIAASGQTVLVAGAGGGSISAFDVSRWSGLRVLDRLDMDTGWTKLVAFADRAFSMDFHGDLTVLDIANPSSLAVLQTLAPVVPVSWEGTGYGIPPAAAAGYRRAYASAQGLGLMVYASGPAEAPPGPARPPRAYLPLVQRAHQRPPPIARRELKPVGRLGSPGVRMQVMELAADEHHAYLAMGEYCAGSLGIVDVSRPAEPAFASKIDLPFTPIALRVVDGRVYAAGLACNPAGSGALAIIDVARPEEPRLVGSLRLPQVALDLVVQGDWVYVVNMPPELTDFTTGDTGPPSVRIVDIADPAAPREVGHIPLSSAALGTGIAAVDGYVLVSDFSVGLRVFDVANPGAPREVATVPIPGAFDVVVEGRRAFVASVLAGDGMAPSGLWIFDIANPARPREMGALTLVEQAQGDDATLVGYRLAVSEGVAYSNRGELHAIDVHDPAWPYTLDRAPANGMGVTAVGRHVYTVGDGLSIFELVDR
jgi:hypothetical protein